MLHNKLKGMKCRTACKQMFGPYTPWTPGREHFFTERGCVAFQIKGKCRKFDLIYTTDLWDWVKRSDIEIFCADSIFLLNLKC